MPQFRTLFFLSRQGGASLSEVAEHIGLTLPSMSKMVEGLVTRELTVRQTHPDDRRRMTLALTTRGRATLQSAREATEACLAGLFRTVPSKERAELVRAMRILRPVFAQPRSAETRTER